MTNERVTHLNDVRAAMSRPRKPDNKAKLANIDPCGVYDGMEAGTWMPDELGLPPDCPVVPLGFDDDTFYFMSARGTLMALTPNNSGRGYISALFTPYKHYPAWAWPKTAKGGKPSGQFHADDVREGLFEAAAKAGPWNAVEKVRGLGAWVGDNGNLILHLGDRVIDGQVEVSPGAIDGFLYPKRPPLDPPRESSGNAGHQLLSILNQWNWSRPELDPELVLGWIVAALIGGALKRRPIIYVTGDRGNGKSTLMDVVAMVIGKGLIKSSDATRAGIDQKIKSDAIPVMLDEQEAKADPRRASAMLELARTAYDGSLTLRGGADHNGKEFRARSCFWFSSINPSAMLPQDRSRMAVLEMLAIPNDARDPVIDRAQLAEIGQELLFKAQQWWPKFHDLLNLFHDALKSAGHDSRNATTWGILAACSYMARADDLPDQELLDEWAKTLNPKELEDFEAVAPDWKNCINYLLTKHPKALERSAEGERSVGGIIEAWRADELNLLGVRRKLQLLGMTVVFPQGELESWENAELFVCNSHSGLQDLFAGQHWVGMAGGMSVWSSALRKMPREWWRSGTARVNGTKQRGTLIQLAKITGDEDD